MSKDPAILMYTADLLVGMTEMTMRERGQYITLLCLQHQKGPMDLLTMKRAAGKISEKVLAKFCISSDKKFYNKRMAEEMEKRAKKSAKNSANALKRWKKDKNLNLFNSHDAYAVSDANAYANDMHRANENENKKGRIVKEGKTLEEIEHERELIRKYYAKQRIKNQGQDAGAAKGNEPKNETSEIIEAGAGKLGAAK